MVEPIIKPVTYGIQFFYQGDATKYNPQLGHVTLETARMKMRRTGIGIFNEKEQSILRAYFKLCTGRMFPVVVHPRNEYRPRDTSRITGVQGSAVVMFDGLNWQGLKNIELSDEEAAERRDLGLPFEIVTILGNNEETVRSTVSRLELPLEAKVEDGFLVDSLDVPSSGGTQDGEAD